MKRDDTVRAQKRRTNIILSLITLIIILVVVIGVEVFGIGLETKLTKTFAENIDENVPEAQTYKSKYKKADRSDEDAQEDTTRQKREYEKYVFVGDSRYKGMAKANATEDDIFISEVGQGYSYMMSQMSTIRAQVDGDSALIIGLGVNDLNNVESYINEINEMSETMDCQIYYMLVNPVDEYKEAENGYHIKNDDIDYFNQEMIDNLNEEIIIIDTNSYLNVVGYETQDGLHYTEETYEKIYKYIKSQL